MGPSHSTHAKTAAGAVGPTPGTATLYSQKFQCSCSITMRSTASTNVPCSFAVGITVYRISCRQMFPLDVPYSYVVGNADYRKSHRQIAPYFLHIGNAMTFNTQVKFSCLHLIAKLNSSMLIYPVLLLKSSTVKLFHASNCLL